MRAIDSKSMSMAHHPLTRAQDQVGRASVRCDEFNRMLADIEHLLLNGNIDYPITTTYNLDPSL